MITSNTTIETAPFTGLWLTSVLINNNQANIMTLPYNGTHALVSPATRHNVTLSNNLLTEIKNAIQRKAATEADLMSLIISAPSPDRPIIMRALFKDVKKPFHIRDVYKVIESDPIFGDSFNSVMYKIGEIINPID